MSRIRSPSVRALAASTAGATAVEFAMIALALMLFTFGVIELGRMLWTWQVLQSTAIDTARCVAIGSSQCSNGATYAVSIASQRGVGTLTTSNVTVTSTSTTNCSGVSGITNFTTVNITFTYKPLLANFIPTPSGGLTAKACFPNNS